MGTVWFLLSLSALAPAPVKSVLVFPVDVHGSARPGLKDVLSDRVLSQTRMSGAFSRVVSTGDLQTALEVQRQKQLMDCDTNGCWAELAGAMGADAFLRVSVGQLGNKALVDARLVGTRSSTAIAAANLSACDASEEATEAAVTSALVNVFSQAGLRHTLQSTRVTSCAQEPATAQAPPAAPSTPGRTSRRWPALVVAGTGGGLAAAGVLLFLAASVATAVLYVLPTVTYVWTPVGDNPSGRRAILDTVVFAAAAVAGVAALGTLVSAATGLAGAAAWAVL